MVKRLISCAILLVLSVSLFACSSDLAEDSGATTELNTTTEPQSTSPPHQELLKTEGTFDSETMLRISLPDVGLENAVICSVSGNYWLDETTHGRVCLLGVDSYNSKLHVLDHYLLIIDGEQTVVKDLAAYENQGNYSGHVALHDMDGDGDSEILLQQTIGMTGGAGSYLSRVFDYKDGEIIEIFSTDAFWDIYGINVGYTIELHENQQFTIKNEITGYSEMFRLENRDEEYFRWWYGDNGEIYQQYLMIDSFFEFLPVDIGNDGVYEIACSQYVSLIGHADGIGHAKTVLKYNTATSRFEIIDADFELYNYG